MKYIHMATGGGGKDRPPKDTPDDPENPDQGSSQEKDKK